MRAEPWLETGIIGAILRYSLECCGATLQEIEGCLANPLADNVMALFKNGAYLHYDSSAAFDGLHSPGEVVIQSGVYRCQTCGREIASNAMDRFPPQNHHQHVFGAGAILWRLVVATQG